jgi:hypothetical protein
MARPPSTATTARAAEGAARNGRDGALPGHLDHGRMKKLLGYNLAQAAIPSFKIFQKRIGEPFQLRRLDFTILMLVAANPGVTQRQMSLALDVSAPRLTLVCDKLEERELLGHLTALEQTMLFQLLEKVAVHRRV